MKVPEENIEDTIRVSWGTDTELKIISDAFTQLVNTVKSISL